MVESIINQDLKEALMIMGQKYGPDQLSEAVGKFAQKVVDQHDASELEFIKHIFFPSVFPPVRIPSLIPKNTAIGRVHGSFVYGSPQTGTMTLTWTPQSPLDQDKLAVNRDTTAAPGFNDAATQQKYGALANANVYMTSMRYLGAEICIEYIGSVEECQGYWVAGLQETVTEGAYAAQLNHTYNGAAHVSESSILDSQFSVEGKVGETIRLVHVYGAADREWVGTAVLEDRYPIIPVYYLTIYGAKPSAGNFRIKYCQYYEYVVHPNFTDLIQGQAAKPSQKTPEQVGSWFTRLKNYAGDKFNAIVKQIPGSSLVQSAYDAAAQYITPKLLETGGGLLSSLGSLLPSWGKALVPIGMGASLMGKTLDNDKESRDGYLSKSTVYDAYKQSLQQPKNMYY